MGFWSDLWDDIVDAFTPATHVLEKHLTEGARKARKPIVPGHYEPAKGEVTDEEVINYFAGLETSRAVFPAPNNRLDTPYEIGDFQGEFEKRLGMGGVNPVYDHLQCLRLRYRIADTESKDRTLFKLGVNIKVVKLGITLDRINRAGSEGIFDLYTHWLGRRDQYNTIAQGSYPKGCVPPANLLA